MPNSSCTSARGLRDMKITEWLGLEGTLKPTQCHPACHGLCAPQLRLPRAHPRPRAPPGMRQHSSGQCRGPTALWGTHFSFLSNLHRRLQSVQSSCTRVSVCLQRPPAAMSSHNTLGEVRPSGAELPAPPLLQLESHTAPLQRLGSPRSATRVQKDAQ